MDTPQRSFIAQLARDATQFASVAPRLQRGLGNVVAGVVDQLSTSPLDFVYQLLQNADDKEYDQGVLPEMGFAIKPTREGGFVHAWDNGVEMSNEQVEALVTFRSTKRDDRGTIGEKGIGWHSVFRVTQAPHVYSGGFSFKLGGGGLESMLTPQWVEDKDLPYQPRPGTNFFLPLRELDDATLRDLDSLRERFSPMTLLFLRKLRKVSIEPQRFAVEVEGDTYTVRMRSSKAKCERVLAQAIVVRPPPADLPADIQPRDAQIVFAFPLEPAGPQSLFAWLPVMASGLKFLVHADFVTTLSREALLADAWNAWLWKKLPEALVASVKKLVEVPEAPLYSTWLNLWPTGDLIMPELQTAITAAEEILRGEPVVATFAGLQVPTACILAAEDERLLVPPAELARIGRHYPLGGPAPALARLGAEVFSPALLRRYTEEQPDALLQRYETENDLLDRMVQYLQRHDVRDIACLPVSTRRGVRLQAPAAQLLGSANEEVNKLADMGLEVVLVHPGPGARAWLEGAGLRRATPEAVLEAILASQGEGGDLHQSGLQVHYLHTVWDQLSVALRARLSSELLVWTESVTGERERTPIQQTHIRDDSIMRLFNGTLPLDGQKASTPPRTIRFMSKAYDFLESSALERLGAWGTVRLEECVVDVPFSSHRGHALLDQWTESDKLPPTGSGYKFSYWVFPDDVCKHLERVGGSVRTAFLELIASHWDAYEARRTLRLTHSWRSKRNCPHGSSTCEKCTSTRQQRWEHPPFLQKLRAMHVPTTLGSDRRSWRPLETTILLPARERARLGGLQLPMPGLAADINNATFLRACGVATEVTADILLRGLQQLREQPPTDDLLRQVQAFYGLLERVTSDEAFNLSDDWPILACDPCPRELERRALEGAGGGAVKERQAALHSEMQRNLRWFSLRDVRWDGPPRVVAGRFALLSQQRTSDARRVYTRFVSDVLRVPDVGASDLVDVLDGLAAQVQLGPEDAEKVVQIYEELAQSSRINPLDEVLLGRLRRRLLTHRRVFVSGLVFACDNPRELGLAQQPDIHFLHFPQAVASHPRFLAQLGVPLAKEALRETYVGQGGSLDRASTDVLRSRLEYLARVALHLLPQARSLQSQDWASFGELARVEVVPEVVVDVQLGPAQTQRRVPHAVDWSPLRCAVVLGKEHQGARSARGQRVLAAGVANLLATVCRTSSTTELLRLVGLVLVTPQQELDDLAEDERLSSLPPMVLMALGQRHCEAPAALLAPLRDAPDAQAEPLEPAGPPPGLQHPSAIQGAAAASADALAEQIATSCAEEVLMFSEPLLHDRADEVASWPNGEKTQASSLCAAERRREEEAAEAARLRVEAALARGDAAQAEAAARESPLPLDEALAKKVRRLVRQQAAVEAVREAMAALTDALASAGPSAAASMAAAETLRETARQAEKLRSTAGPLQEVLREARKCLQEQEKQKRRDAALERLRECGAAAAASADSAGAEVLQTLEGALTEAWEAGLEEDHADFVRVANLLSVARLRQACDAVEAALSRGSHSATATASSALRAQLPRAEGAPDLDKARAARLLEQVESAEAVTRELSNALAAMDAHRVRQALESAQDVPLAATWAGHAERFLRQREELDARRGALLGRLAAARDGDLEELGTALRLARECCHEGDLETYEATYRTRGAAADEARRALRAAPHVDQLREVLDSLPAGTLPEAELAQWLATLDSWVAQAEAALAAFDLVPREDVEGLQQALDEAVAAGVPPPSLRSMQEVVAQQALEDQERQRAVQVGWELQQQGAAWWKYLKEEVNVTMESATSAADFAESVNDKRLRIAAQELMAKVEQADDAWQQAEDSDTAVDWRVAAAMCRASQQQHRGHEADARARRAEEREAVRLQLAQPAGEAVLLSALQRAEALGVPEQSMATARARLLEASAKPAGPRGPRDGPPVEEAAAAASRPPPGGARRAPPRVLPGEYGVKLFGRWERVSPYGAEALAELGLLQEDAKLRWGQAEVPLHVVTKPKALNPVEGDVLGKELRRVERKLQEITALEEKILAKEKLSKEEWHMVAHKTVYMQEHKRLQAKLVASGAECGDFAEVWEAVCMVRSKTGADPFQRHLLEGAPAEPGRSQAPVGGGGRLDGSSAKRVGALGELYVFTWLQQMVEGFGFENWCSSCRTAHPEAPPPAPDVDRWGCDFWFRDTGGIFCKDKEVFLEVKSMRVRGDPDAVRATDFTCRLSGNELAVMKEAAESDNKYYVMLWVAIGDNLTCRVVAILRQPSTMIPAQLSLQPTEYSASLVARQGPPGLSLADPDEPDEEG